MIRCDAHLSVLPHLMSSTPTASPEASAERCDSRLPGGLQGVQSWWESPVYYYQRGFDRRHHREHRVGQPEEVHSVQCGGPGCKQSWNRAIFTAGGNQDPGGWWAGDEEVLKCYCSWGKYSCSLSIFTFCHTATKRCRILGYCSREVDYFGGMERKGQKRFSYFTNTI